MIKLNKKRYEFFRALFSNTVKYSPSKVIFAYGPNLFKFHHKGRTIEVNPNCIIIRQNNVTY